MHHTFTGSGRKPRQVNLSGRNAANPFASNQQRGNPQGSQNAVVQAQVTRAARQQERERANAATKVQKMWRGHVERQNVAQELRKQWDEAERLKDPDVDEGVVYDDSLSIESHLMKLLSFFKGALTPHEVRYGYDGDLMRLKRFYFRHRKTIQQKDTKRTGGLWPKAYLRLQEVCLASLGQHGTAKAQGLLLDIIKFTAEQTPDATAQNAPTYYQSLQKILTTQSLPIEIFVAPFRVISEHTLEAYQSFVCYVLTIPEFERAINSEDESPKDLLKQVANHINCYLFAHAVALLILEGRIFGDRSDRSQLINYKDLVGGPDAKNFDIRMAELGEEERPLVSWDAPAIAPRGIVWVLGYLIYFHRAQQLDHSALETDYTFCVASLLSSVADHIDLGTPLFAQTSQISSFTTNDKVVNSFVSEQIHSLVTPDGIRGLLSQANLGHDTETRSNHRGSPNLSKVFANYILTLLRLFPGKADDIRMWLYLGIKSQNQSSPSITSNNVSVIKYFWESMRQTQIFSSICQDPKASIQSLKPTPQTHMGNPFSDQWRVILLFMELYTFVLRIMDDDEFFSSSLEVNQHAMENSIGRRNNLSLGANRELSTFLKNLGFAMYYHAADILNSREEERRRDLSTLFKSRAAEPTPQDKSLEGKYLAGLQGINLEYMKGLVTGLARAIHERDSRRPFLPKNHWLLSSNIFDTRNLIDRVVEEEERRHQVQEAEDEDDDAENNIEDEIELTRPSLVGTSVAQRQRQREHDSRQQREASRRRYLQAVAPRLEILQNMPFLIPFSTRVQIFRKFVQLDQFKRREGAVDPEIWRMQHMHPFGHSAGLEKHHASIRRGYEFEDAYDAFYELGSGLKEPIHISFVDQFNNAEPGIDGGGVTKEFLTSVTSQAFTNDQGGIKLFIENSKRLLFPNPSAIDEQSEILKEAGYPERDKVFRDTIKDMLNRYEFLGRVIGKCMYEGILVDIGFAPFFLLKWALTGGTGSAPNESGYRANLNDLREYDEELYQGLLKLKNYPGDVEDFGLNFTVTDSANLPPLKPGQQPRTKNITRELVPNGSRIPVDQNRRLVYISCIARHRLSTQPSLQSNAFLRGLSSMIPPAWLSMFNQTELQTLVGGAPAAIDVEDLRRNTTYGGLYVIGDDGQEHESVKIFWEVMHDLPDADRRKLLKYVTSTPRAPLLGFGSLNPRFSIRDSGPETGGRESSAGTMSGERLPSTSTCVNLLKLPRYKTKEVCRGKLLQAVNSGAGFDLS
ncbi:MAG: hypothetical protein M1831_005392 [Alyxoria varia]|nr:MAG: hypothetical protein M1831_005392 [Alyxoria varia]